LFILNIFKGAVAKKFKLTQVQMKNVWRKCRESINGMGRFANHNNRQAIAPDRVIRINQLERELRALREL
jgi:hypothetical protein